MGIPRGDQGQGSSAIGSHGLDPQAAEPGHRERAGQARPFARWLVAVPLEAQEQVVPEPGCG